MGKILVIDDEENIRNVFKRALEKANHQAIVAENGIVGEQMYKQNKPDVIILDILMPDQEGIETLLNLKAFDSNVKIIAISGGGMGSANYYLDNAMKLGARFAMEKPVVISDLISKVEKLLVYA
jgi:two-component system, chemotaxis family, chemotaxis protein CheY